MNYLVSYFYNFMNYCWLKINGWLCTSYWPWAVALIVGLNWRGQWKCVRSWRWRQTRNRSRWASKRCQAKKIDGGEETEDDSSNKSSDHEMDFHDGAPFVNPKFYVRKDMATRWYLDPQCLMWLELRGTTLFQSFTVHVYKGMPIVSLGVLLITVWLQILWNIQICI